MSGTTKISSLILESLKRGSLCWKGFGWLTCRELLWQMLSTRKNQSPVKCWCLVRDFNCVRHPAERLGSNHYNSDTNLIIEFNDWLHDMEVDDIPCVGKPFT